MHPKCDEDCESWLKTTERDSECALIWGRLVADGDFQGHMGKVFTNICSHKFENYIKFQPIAYLFFNF